MLRLTAFLGLLFTSNIASAGLISFYFEFVNSANDGGTVAGVIRGLTDDATSAASSVEVLGNTAGFGIGEYIGNPSINTFTVAGGALVTFDFVSFGALNSAPDVTCCSLRMTFDVVGMGLSQSPGGVASAQTAFTATPVPEPGSIALLGCGLLWAGWVRRRGCASGAKPPALCDPAPRSPIV